MRLVPLCFSLAAALVTFPASAQTFRTESSGSIGFGGAAAIAGDQVLIGRPGTLIGFPIPATHAGAVHVFRRDGDRWAESGMLSAKDGSLGDGFGTSLAVDGTLLAVGAPGAAGGGAVYLFERGSGGRWTERTRLTGAGGAEGDRFGAAVALKGGVLLASSYPNRTSPVLRGAWVLEKILGTHPPQPPPGHPPSCPRCHPSVLPPGPAAGLPAPAAARRGAPPPAGSRSRTASVRPSS